jgi:hypothetical protein
MVAVQILDRIDLGPPARRMAFDLLMPAEVKPVPRAWLIVTLWGDDQPGVGDMPQTLDLHGFVQRRSRGGRQTELPTPHSRTDKAMWTFEGETPRRPWHPARRWVAYWRRWGSRSRTSAVISLPGPAFSVAAWQESSCFCYWPTPPRSSRCGRCFREYRAVWH